MEGYFCWRYIGSTRPTSSRYNHWWLSVGRKASLTERYVIDGDVRQGSVSDLSLNNELEGPLIFDLIYGSDPLLALISTNDLWIDCTLDVSVGISDRNGKGSHLRSEHIVEESESTGLPNVRGEDLCDKLCFLSIIFWLTLQHQECTSVKF